MEALWRPSPERIKNSHIHAFIKQAQARYDLQGEDYDALYAWSVERPQEFWNLLWEFAEVRAAQRSQDVLSDAHKMPGARWFPQAQLNFADNLLRRRDTGTAIRFWGENRVKRSLSYAELYTAVSRLAQAFTAAGIGVGDRVAAYLPNIPETLIAMLATSAIGAVWSSCSPDFGVQGVLDRFGQIQPKLLLAVDGYFYNGKSHDCLDKLAVITNQLPSLNHVLLIEYTGSEPPARFIPKLTRFNDFIAPFSSGEIEFAALPFDHPLYIMYSSGTTGAPKCIVHGAGGTLLQHLKEHLLHVDLKRDDRLFYFTTCGWMMWNWLVSGLAAEASLMLYDGSPFYPNGNILFDFADAEEMSIFGTSAKYIDALAKAKLQPRNTHRLNSLKTMLSTGSPLAPESFNYVYQAVKPDIALASISGGTDIISCFALGCPIRPVYRGELQCRGLGLKVEVCDEAGNSVVEQKGELCCTAPFPSMPIGFWNDPDGSRYHEAYFAKFPKIWCHGDYVELTARDGLIIYGRSDAVLNPGGVRIGTAEIYRQAEQIDAVVESLVISQNWQDDVRIVLFVRLREGFELSEQLVASIKQQIRTNATPRHVPAKIIQVADIPRTKSGKIVELAVRNVVHGEAIKNKEALANPEALELFKDLQELREA